MYPSALRSNPGPVAAAASLPRYGTELLEIEPQRCKPWPHHNRDQAWFNRQRCADLINSIQRHGQMEPVIVRALALGSEPSFEIISGVRRWFACSQIPHRTLLARMIEADDKTCMILMHAENADSQDITEFERACSFAAHMKSGVFKNQIDLAKTFRVSQSTISKMIKVAELFDKSWFATLFESKLDIPIRQSYRLSTLLKKPELGSQIEMEAQVILEEKNKTKSPLPARLILQRLIRHVRSQSSREEAFTNNKVLLAKEREPIITLKEDPDGNLSLTMDPRVRQYNREQITALWMQAMDNYWLKIRCNTE
ncbi:MAG: ParB/RepB/Spo0J family partition protein [Gammaproteobacteria bacterium]|nr:ParB/RepB/Spo0J family partition protein [Gammaproteobacteria bacterium]